tara:strand:- start:6018 stop:6548 length:531 start_codon:yes stop_codon:yes gene_type:complete
MITSEGNYQNSHLTTIGDGYATTIETNGNGGQMIRNNQQVNFVSNTKGIPTYNVGFGSTVSTAAWVEWTAREFDAAGISTSEFDPTKPDERKTVQINVPASNIWTVSLYGETTKLSGRKPKFQGFFDLYENGDDRKARHKALREAGLTPPFPRADKFSKNKHQNFVRSGVTTEGSY